MKVKQGSLIAKILQWLIVQFVILVYGKAATILFGFTPRNIYVVKDDDDRVTALVFLNESERRDVKDVKVELIMGAK